MLLPTVNTQKRWLLFLLVGVFSIHTYLDFTFRGPTEERGQYIDSIFARVFTPITWIFESGKLLLADWTIHFQDLWTAAEDNKQLRHQISELSLRIQELESESAEARRLKDSLKMVVNPRLSFIVGRVTGYDRSVFRQAFDINRGESDGVLKGMPVLSAQGVVGRIVSVSSHRSTVLLLNDLESRVEGIVERTRARVVVGGSADGSLNLRYLPRRFDLQPGDRILTSGFGGFFPPGFLIGTLISIVRDPHFVLESARLESAVDMNKVEEIFIVKTVDRWPSNP